MNLSTQRLTLYALITSIEKDMRALIVNHIYHNRYINNILTQEEHEKVTKRRNKDAEVADGEIIDDELFDFLDFSAR